MPWKLTIRLIRPKILEDLSWIECLLAFCISTSSSSSALQDTEPAMSSSDLHACDDLFLRQTDRNAPEMSSLRVLDQRPMMLLLSEGHGENSKLAILIREAPRKEHLFRASNLFGLCFVIEYPPTPPGFRWRHQIEKTYLVTSPRISEPFFG